MTSRYRLTPQNTSSLEIRGWSRGSAIDNNTRNRYLVPSSSLDLITFNEDYRKTGLRHTPGAESDDDDSTIKGGSSGGDYPPPKALPGEDALTVSESSHYWSGANSSTTGNTTERSSLYSWGDDVLDHKTSRDVQDMFQAIEKMLFESVLSGSSLLQHECREWMDAFPHLRILGKQTAPVRDEGFQSLPSSQNVSGVATPVSEPHIPESSDSSNLVLSGSSITPSPIPVRYMLTSDISSESSHFTDLSHLHEEIFEQDGSVEEYLAYDIREMDEDETAKRYHVPRRRRLGYPPITPNACVRDAVINQLFDLTWVKLISSLDKVKIENEAAKKTNKSLWKVLFDNYRSAMKQIEDNVKSVDNAAYLYQGTSKSSFAFFYDQDERGGFDDGPYRGNFDDRNINPNALFVSNSEHFHGRLPPPSRGGYLDQNLAGGRMSGRLSTTDFQSLDGVMKISRKKLQVRTDKPNGAANQDSSLELVMHPMDTANLYGREFNTSRLQLHGTSSPQVRSHFSLHGITNRQQSAKNKGRTAGRPARLQPLGDRARTPTGGFDGMAAKGTKLPIASMGHNVFDGPSEIVGIRVMSPTDPPPTAPASSGGNLYSRLLPPLEAVNENASIEFSKNKLRGRVGRISSAIADDSFAKQTWRGGWEGVSRPNTTQAFRNDGHFRQRASPLTPNFSTRITGARGSLQVIKSSSPTGLGNMFYPQNFGHSPDNQIPGLAGIHGISMLGHSNPVQSPDEHDDDGRTWGNPVRRKQLIGN
ncbi:uncharacterized protein LOC120337565 [Styela clava]|uniref:uncharacterized protein LOC120337565 n=1 Tax=Styela clava TaxID=7725 RepID=UPI00193A33BC|nr:uncharacterized protein LOC120337565 [Styela clava]